MSTTSSTWLARNPSRSRPVLHPFQLRFHQGGELAEVAPGQVGHGELVPCTARALGGQRWSATGGKRPPPPIRRDSAHPEPAGPPPGHWPAPIKSAAASRTCSR